MKVLFALMLVSTAASANNDALLKCRQLEDGPVRLACYNAIPAVAGASTATASASAPAAKAVAAAAPVSAGTYTMATPSRQDMEMMFGQEPPILKSVRLEQIETSIPGPFDGWVPGQRIRLANGQVWKVVDGSDDVMDVAAPAPRARTSGRCPGRRAWS
jgi:hypothetical protein